MPASTVTPPLVDECYASLLNKYNFFVLEVVKAWIDREMKTPWTLHRGGNGVFAVDGEIIKLRSGKK